MEHFDEVVTGPTVKLAAVHAHLADARFLDRYIVSATSGTTGRQGLFLDDPDEWRTVTASYARANAWAGVRVNLLRPADTLPVDPLTTDDDLDGVTENDGDCNDHNDAVYPGATEDDLPAIRDWRWRSWHDHR